MSTPPTKRQRISATSGIHKPFRSPLRHTTSSTQSPTTASSTTAVRSTITSAPENAYTPLRSSTLKRTFTAPPATPTTPSHSSSHDPDIQAAQSQLRRLETQIRHLRAQNAVLSQALELPAPSEDVSSSPAKKSGRLQRLIEKWKAASQAAAEELWPDFEKRIKDNGGFGASNGRQGQHPGWMGDDGVEEREEDWRDELGEELTVREKERRRGERGRKAARKEEEEEAEQEEEEVGMKYMLGVLNIPLETIGWDDLSQTWLP